MYGADVAGNLAGFVPDSTKADVDSLAVAIGSVVPADAHFHLESAVGFAMVDDSVLGFVAKVEENVHLGAAHGSVVVVD